MVANISSFPRGRLFIPLSGNKKPILPILTFPSLLPQCRKILEYSASGKPLQDPQDRDNRIAGKRIQEDMIRLLWSFQLKYAHRFFAEDA